MQGGAASLYAIAYHTRRCCSRGTGPGWRRGDEALIWSFGPPAAITADVKRNGNHQMATAPRPEMQGGGPLRALQAWAAAGLTALILLGGPAFAQTPPEQRSGMAPQGMASQDAVPQDMAPQGEAPLILAPLDAGRQPPTALSLMESGGGGSFSAMDVAPPLTARLPSAPLPVVVELFTSQGCSSCPPADAMLTLLAGKPDVLALSFHVDYWDYLGWADSFATPEFTERQAAYARAAGERSVYTPQMIVAGQDTAVAPGPAQLMGLIDAHLLAPAFLSVQREPTEQGEAIELMPLSDLGGSVDILLVRYAPHRQVDVRAGENRGKSVVYSNVVLEVQHLSRWDGVKPLHMTVRAQQVEDDRFPPDTRHALLVQEMLPPEHLPGAILAAIRLD
ncbi:DUF1223 domain-containing protein [Paracoccus liaowanqingii]|uniref:DUF1223 domain-containing protein n=2 Tax=Paracoccus liaowanqingii TaxID=2560053 RepID=A0A4Z1C9Z7_9RHOB|nr:DUF1223 domain-containing protein [Paracoccus liaowanqingii]